VASEASDRKILSVHTCANQITLAAVTGLKPPLGLGATSEVTESQIELFLWEADIPIYRFHQLRQSRVYYNDVLYRLSRRAFGATITSDLNLDDEDEDSPEAMALAALKRQRLIFSTQEYIAVKRIVKAIKKKQGKHSTAFMELVFSIVRREEELAEIEMEHDHFELFKDVGDEKRNVLIKLKKFATNMGAAFKD